MPRPVPAALQLALASLLALALGGTLPACGDSGEDDSSPPEPTLSLLSPSAPLGLHYTERSTLSVRYRKGSRPVPGATVSVHIDRDDSGATLSADRLITNDRGDASVLLTAAAAETSFRVVFEVSGVTSLLVYVAVSRFDFGNIDVLADATAFGSTALVRVGLVQETACAALPPTPLPLSATRSNQASERRAPLPFPVLLVKPYGVYARAEDSQGRLVAYGCIEIPDALLRTGLRPLVPVPLSAAMPSPLGSFDLEVELSTQAAAPDPFAGLACGSGQGQLLLDGIDEALAVGELELGSRIRAQRSSLDAQGCRSGPGYLDGRLHSLLAATSSGAQLAAAASDMAALRRSLTLGTTLSVFTGSGRLYQANHLLRFARFALPAGSMQYSLSTLPINQARDLPLDQTGATLVVPPHELMLGLPGLWQRAIDDLALRPRGIAKPASQLFQAAVNAAQASTLVGCAAVESQICEIIAPPCAGKVAPACSTARDSLVARLSAALSSLPPALDLSLSMMLHMEDTTGQLQAQRVGSGEVSGSVSTVAGAVTLTGSARGPKL